MERLEALTAEQLARAEERLLHPRPGSRIAAARDFGVDLTLLLAQLRLSPEERAAQMLEVCDAAEELRGAASAREAQTEVRSGAVAVLDPEIAAVVQHCLS